MKLVEKTAQKVKYRFVKIILKLPSFLSVPLLYRAKLKKGEDCYKKNLLAGEKLSLEKRDIFLCPYKGTGDVYLALSFLKNFYASFDAKQEPCVCVVGNSNKKIATLFGIENVIVLSQQEMDSVLFFSLFMGAEKMGVHLLHADPPKMHEAHIGITDWMRNINGLNFFDILRVSCLASFRSLDASVKVQKLEASLPVFEKCSDEIDELFQKYNLQRGRTVLLSPYTYTLSEFPKWFWKKLAERLQEKGFSVCTNVAGKDEEAVENTVPIFLPYAKMESFLEAAGFFIGIRSGFCEVISSIPCKKIILYQPYFFWGDGENIDYFSLNKMGLCDNAVELQHKGIDFYSLIDEIKNSITAIR